MSCYSQAKEVIKGKGKRGRKCKSAALEADEQEPKVACVAKDAMNDKGKRGQKRESAAQEVDEPEPEPEVARVIEEPKPWRAPVARMIDLILSASCRESICCRRKQNFTTLFGSNRCLEAAGAGLTNSYWVCM